MFSYPFIRVSRRLIWLWLLMSAAGVFAQPEEIKFEHISLEQGLSQSLVFCILQDSKGVLWFGTADGLNEYDGYTFKIYKHDPDDPQSLSDNEIYSICEDSSGDIWIGTWDNGLNKFDRNKGEFFRYQYNPANPSGLPHDKVRALFVDQEGALWVGSGRGLSKYDHVHDRFIHFQHDPENPNSLSHNSVSAIEEDKYGYLWIGTTAGGLNRFDRTSEEFTRYLHDSNNPASLSHNKVRAIHEDRSGDLWIGTDLGLNKFDRQNESFVHYLQEPHTPKSRRDKVTSICQDKSGRLWLGSYGGGLNRFDPIHEKFAHFEHNARQPSSLSDNIVLTVYSDRSGIVWAGGYTGGLNKFDQQQIRFGYFTADPNDENSLSDRSVRSFCQDREGNLWVGTDAGLNKYERQSNTLTRFKYDPHDPGSLRSNIIGPVLEDRSGTLWVGTIWGGLHQYDEKSGSFVSYQHDPQVPQSLSNDDVTSICEDQSGALWVGTHNGLNRLDRKNGNFSHFQNDPQNPQSLSSNAISSIYEDRLGVLWIGTRKGLNRFDRKREAFLSYQHVPDKTSSLSDDVVWAICEDQSGYLWVGTQYGLNRFSGLENEFIRFTEKDGLPGNFVVGILEDDDGNLWISTTNGLTCFNPTTGVFRSFDMSDGLQSKEFNDGAYFMSKSGEMFFGGINGFNFFYPDKVQNNPFIPPVVITHFERYNSDHSKGTPIIEKGITEKDHIELSYKDDILTFEFAALNYTNSHKNQYAYQLEGFTDNWIHLGTRRRVTFTNLDPGEYTLRVKGSNNDGAWNEEGTSLKIFISPPWWKTWWAYTLYGLLALGLLYGIRRSELNRQKLRHEAELEHLEADKLQEVDRLKTRFFANISHEFRTPLTLIQGPVQRWLEKTDQPEMRRDFEMMHRNTQRLLRLVNQLLDISRLESGKVKLLAREQDIVPLTRQLVMAFESLASVRDISLKFETEEESVSAYIDREKYEKIIINLVSNAIKFTPEKGRIEVAVGSGSPDGRRERESGRRGERESGRRGERESGRRGERESGRRGEKESGRVGEMESGDKSQVRLFPASLAGPLNGNDEIQFVEIRVTDSGVGIPAGQLPHIFDRFYQVEDPGTGEQGTGIGLALTKELVELHHGKITVESTPGKGSIFTVRIPRGKEHLMPDECTETPLVRAEHPVTRSNRESQEAARDTSPQLHQPQPREREARLVSHPPAHAPTLLIVEDNPDMRSYIRSHLEGSYRILEAENGEEGLKRARKQQPDLIISDVMMPQMDGFQLCEKIKTDGRISHIPVILLTAKALQQSKLKGLATGADDYLTKPFDAAELKLRVKNLIEQRRILRERFQRELRVEPQEITVTSADEAFLKQAIEIVETHMGDEQFDTASFAKEIAISRSQLNIKLRALTGCSTREFIRTLRLKRAAQLLEQGFGNVAEVAYEVGFNSLSHFSKVFESQFGVLPSRFAPDALRSEIDAH